MKIKNMAAIGMLLCFMMMPTGAAWSAGIPGVPNGTVTDGNLVWLKNANCFGALGWDEAMSRVRSLKSGECGLNDGSRSGDWRLPTKDELKRRAGNTAAFYNVKPNGYWAFSTDSSYTFYAWYVTMDDGHLGYGSIKTKNIYTWPVRDP